MNNIGSKLLLSLLIFTHLSCQLIAGNMNLIVNNLSEEGDYSLSIEDSNKKNVIFGDNKVDSEIYSFKNITKGQYLVKVYDNHPSITRSCIFASTINYIGEDVTIDVPKKIISIKIHFNSEDDIPYYYPKNKKWIIIRLRLIDEYGEVFRWIPLRRGKGLLFSGELQSVQTGSYLFEIMERKEKVYGTVENTGYSVYTKKILIDQKSVLEFQIK